MGVKSTFAGICFLTALSVRAGLVTTLADDESEGTLRSVLVAASEGETITFDGALAGGTITLAAAKGPLTPTVSVSIVGPESRIAISGGNATNLLVSANAAAAITLRNLVFTGSRGYQRLLANPEVGPAVSIVGDADIENCEFHHNTTYIWISEGSEGGGILRVVGNLRLVGCDFYDNELPEAANYTLGGVGRFSGRDILVSGCTFVRNSLNSSGEAIRAGGAFSVGGACTNLLVETTLFASNRFAFAAGAVVFRDDLPVNGLMRFRSCSFRGHGPGKSGWKSGSTVTDESGRAQRFAFESCEFYNSLHPGWGGAVRISASGSRAAFVNCTFVRCRGNQWGGAVDTRCPTWYVNCTVAGNVNGDTSTQGGTLFAINSVHLLNTACVYNYVGNGATAVDLYKYGGTLAAYNCYTHTASSIFSPSDNVKGYVREGTEGLAATRFFVEPLVSETGFTAGGGTYAFANPILVPTVTADKDDPKAARAVEPLAKAEGGVLDRKGWPVKANADYSYVAYSKDGGATWTKLVSSMNDADAASATLILADSRGKSYPTDAGGIPIPPIGSAIAKALGLVLIAR